jgi:hypothetical protein
MTFPGAKMATLLVFVAAAGCQQVGPSPANAAPAAAARRPDASAGAARSVLTAPLQAETPEANPRSETVKLKLTVLPVTAEVVWGAKRLGTAGREPLVIERPRDSGPLDLVIRAAGYLPFHTRLFTDREDAVTIRLVAPSAASGLLGYKRTAPSAPRP